MEKAIKQKQHHCNDLFFFLMQGCKKKKKKNCMIDVKTDGEPSTRIPSSETLRVCACEQQRKRTGENVIGLLHQPPFFRIPFQPMNGSPQHMVRTPPSD